MIADLLVPSARQSRNLHCGFAVVIFRFLQENQQTAGEHPPIGR
jgi:hypothetical protein